MHDASEVVLIGSNRTLALMQAMTPMERRRTPLALLAEPRWHASSVGVRFFRYCNGFPVFAQLLMLPIH